MKTLLLAAAALAFAPRTVRQDEEPAAILSVEVGGRTVQAELGKPFEIETKAGKTTLTVRLEPYRRFDRAGVSFRYPTPFLYEADLDTPGVSIWTLEGKDAIVMVQHFKGRNDPEAVREEVADAMTAQFGKANVKQGEAALAHAGGTLKGTGLEIALAGQRLSYRLFAAASGDDTVVLALQDSPKDDGRPSDESAALLLLLKDSLVLPKGK